MEVTLEEAYLVTSRVLSPLLKGGIAYAAIKEGGESAPGQVTVAELDRLYRVVGK